MRSKEVEEAIEKTKRIRTGLMNFNELLDNNNVVINGIDKVLAYIEELEKMIPTPSNEVPVEYQTSIYVDKRDAVMKSEIIDKIKELEEELKAIQDKLSKNMLFSESEFYSFSEYTKWRVEINQKIKDINSKLEILKSIIGE